MNKLINRIAIFVEFVTFAVMLYFALNQDMGSGAKLNKQLACAHEYLDNKDYKNAINEFDRILKIDDKCIDAYLEFAAAYEAIINQTESEEDRILYYQKILEYLNKGIDATNNDSLKEKVDYFQKQINEKDPVDEVVTDSNPKSNENPVQSIEVNDNVHEMYQDILDIAYIIIDSNGSADYDDSVMTGVRELAYEAPAEENKLKIGYAYIDIDGNGIDELVIIDKGEEQWRNRILNVYTIVNDEPYMLIEGWVNNRFYLLDDNTFYNEGSSGIEFTCFGIYRVSDDCTSIEAVDYYFTGYKDDNKQDWGWFHNTNGSTEQIESEWIGDDEDYIKQLESNLYSRVKNINVTYFTDYRNEKI